MSAAGPGTLEGAPLRLPRGRHGLSRAEVERSQRGRILFAMADAMAVKGYGATSVADVLKGAGVSRQTFYDLFTSKEDCFAAAFDSAAQILLARVLNLGGESEGSDDEAGGSAEGEAPAVAGGWAMEVLAEDEFEGRLQQLDRILGAYLDALADEPAFARLFLVEVYAAGPEALRRRTESQERFAAVLAAVLGAEDEARRFVCEAVVAAVSSLVTTRVAAGDMDGVRALRGPLLGLLRRGFPLLDEGFLDLE